MRSKTVAYMRSKTVAYADIISIYAHQITADCAYESALSAYAKSAWKLYFGITLKKLSPKLTNTHCVLHKQAYFWDFFGTYSKLLLEA